MRALCAGVFTPRRLTSNARLALFVLTPCRHLWHPCSHLAKEQFFYSGSREIAGLIDTAARRAGLSRGQSFEDFLTCVRCALSAEQMEEEYLQTVRKGYDQGQQGKRGIDAVTQAFGRLVALMDDTRKDILGDVFQAAITYGEAGQFLTPTSITDFMTQLTAGDGDDTDVRGPRTVCDLCCGSGRFLLSIAEQHRDWEFVGQDIDFRCVQMTTINLGLRNLYGYVIWGNALSDERKRIFRTGWNMHGGVVREIPVDAPRTAAISAAPDRPSIQPAVEPLPDDMRKTQQRLFD